LTLLQKKLANAKDGAFVVRESTGLFGTITMTHKGRFYQSQIEETPEGMPV
jgi:hypothetical protein